jgi:hypothetical protein
MPQISGIDTLENLLIARAANPTAYAMVPEAVEAALMASVNAALTLTIAVLSVPSDPTH